MDTPRSREARGSRKRSHVTLTTEATLLGGDSVIIGERVCETAAKRSELLSGLGNTEGLAQLPGHLSPADVRLWEAACTFKSDLTIEEVVRALKVCFGATPRSSLRSMPGCSGRGASKAKSACWSANHAKQLALLSQFAKISDL